MSGETAVSALSRRQGSLWRDHGPALVAAVFASLLVAGLHVYNGEDWIGFDNDDAMRMVQVRDLLAGQGWFDLTQYRLGPAGGSSMHWSRLVDAPIAGLVLLFSAFVPVSTAEHAAVFVWPLLTSVPVFLAMAVAARRLGGKKAVLPALIMTILFVYQVRRFAPGSIDHHNVQMALMAILFASLLDRRMSSLSFSIGGIAAATAAAIGAEVLPLVAISCAWIALLWGHYGKQAVGAASAFCLAFALTLAAIFYLTVPPSIYDRVQCDGFSSGVYMIGTVGSGALFLTVSFIRSGSRLTRFAALASAGLGIVVAALILVPNCFSGSLYDIDPLLKELWLDNVTEAQSVLDILTMRTTAAGHLYAVPIFALIICAIRYAKGNGSSYLFAAMALLAAAFLISLYQVRGSTFANLFAIAPLAVFIAERREIAGRPGACKTQIFGYLLAAAASLQFFWLMAGVGLQVAVDAIAGQNSSTGSTLNSCATESVLAGLAKEPPGTVAGISNLGARILLYTHHRAISAPYHRNKDAMLAMVQMGTQSPEKAKNIMREYGADWLVMCPDNKETVILADVAPDGFYAQLKAGQIPPFLRLFSEDKEAGLQIYRVIR